MNYKNILFALGILLITTSFTHGMEQALNRKENTYFLLLPRDTLGQLRELLVHDSLIIDGTRCSREEFPVTFTGHTNKVLSAVFNRAGDTIVTASLDGTAKVWGVDGTLRITLEGHTNKVNSAVFNGAGDTIVTASDDKTALVELFISYLIQSKFQSKP